MHQVSKRTSTPLRPNGTPLDSWWVRVEGLLIGGLFLLGLTNSCGVTVRAAHEAVREPSVTPVRCIEDGAPAGNPDAGCRAALPNGTER